MKEIVKEEEQWTYDMFDKCVNEEKAWADYLFKDGSMIGLNDKLLPVSYTHLTLPTIYSV